MARANPYTNPGSSGNPYVNVGRIYYAQTYGSRATKQASEDEARKRLEQQKKDEEKKKQGGLSGALHAIGHVGAVAGRTLVGGTAKFLNTANLAGHEVYDTARMLAARNPEAWRKANTAAEGDYKRYASPGSGLFGAGSAFKNPEEAKSGNLGTVVKRIGGTTLETAAEIIPVGRGFKLAKGAGLSEALARASLEGAGYSSAAELGRQTSEGQFNKRELGKAALFGGILGGAGAGVGRYVSRASREIHPMPSENSPVKGLIGNGSERIHRGLDDVNKEIEQIMSKPGKGSGARLRELNRQSQSLQRELDGLQVLHPTNQKIDTRIPINEHAIDSELQNVEHALVDKQSKKVNSLTDYFRTPTNVLKKIGLQDTARRVETSFENYRRALPKEQAKIMNWEQRVGNDPAASKRIFQHLDGQDVQLSGEEQKVANEMRTHFEQLADKLGIPKEKRLSNYITHIFDKDIKGQTNDPTLSTILENRPTSEVTNPYLKGRKGAKGFKEDAFLAADAYTKKAMRQLHMNDALKATADASKNVDERTAKYLLSLNERIALKPSRTDRAFNNIISSITGDRLSPNAGTNLLRGWRNTVYRGTLGLNLGSALRNITQGANTFAELGTRDTLIGYTRLLRGMSAEAAQRGRGAGENALDELRTMGIFDDAMHRQDVNYTRASKLLKKVDKGLWALFDTAEKINRGAAYFGAKAKALRKGMSEEAAQNYARDVVGKTQFRFNDVETPLVFRSQVAKTLGQFQSFNIKQAEFLGTAAKGAIKGNPQDIAKLIRWTVANLAIAATVGKLIGFKWTGALPNPFNVRGISTPAYQAGKDVYQGATGKDAFGNEATTDGKPDRMKAIKSNAADLAPLVVPGGTQGKKTIQGLKATNSGFSETGAGRVRFPVGDSTSNKIRAGLFGQYSLPEGQAHFARGGVTLSEKQSSILKNVQADQRDTWYNFFQENQGLGTQKKDVGNQVKSAVDNGDFNRAQRMASDHNAEIDVRINDLEKQVGPLPKDLRDYLESFKVSYSYYRSRK